jgi:hypothetical protein
MNRHAMQGTDGYPPHVVAAAMSGLGGENEALGRDCGHAPPGVAAAQPDSLGAHVKPPELSR